MLRRINSLHALQQLQLVAAPVPELQALVLSTGVTGGTYQLAFAANEEVRPVHDHCDAPSPKAFVLWLLLLVPGLVSG